MADNTTPNVTLYQVTDTNGKPWGFFAQEPMAQQTVDACNADPGMAEWQPFTVQPIKSLEG